MTDRQSTYMTSVISKANSGDIVAIDLVARRFFKGRGVEKSFQRSYYWSTIGLDKGMLCLAPIKEFSFKKLSEESQLCIDKELKDWFDNPINKMK